jgi:predicted dehydrogenase
MVHENFRWQAPMRALKEAAAGLDDPFFCRVSFRSGVDVYTAQPYLATDPRFILYDMGVHLLDLARFFVGEAEYLTCHTQRVNPRIRGEDVATVLLRMAGGATCCVEMSFASTLEEDLFPQTLVHLETGDSSATLGSHYRLTVTDDEGTRNVKLDLPGSDWMEPGFEVVQGSVVATQQHWADCLHTDREPETTGRDNLRTLELVFGAYESAETGEVYRVGTAK